MNKLLHFSIVPFALAFLLSAFIPYIGLARVGGNLPDPSPASARDYLSPVLWFSGPQAPLAAADISVTKSDSADPVLVGDQFTYTITISNTNTVETTGTVMMTDTLPASVTFVSSNPTLPTCDYNSGDHQVICSLDPIAPVSSVEITIVVDTDAASPGTIVNSVTVENLDGDPTPENDTDEEITTLYVEADLGITKSADPSSATAGNPLTYQLTVNNAGPSAATGVVVTDTLPANVTYTGFSSTSFDCTHNSGVVVCQLIDSSLPINTPRTANINVSVAPSATVSLTNQALVGATTPDPFSGNDSVTLDTPVNTSADLGIAKSANPSTAVAGDLLTYQLTVNNAGPSNAASVSVTDTLPDGVTYLSYSAGFFTCDHDAGVVTCSATGSLPVNSPQIINITVRVSAWVTSSLTNQASVSSATADPVSENNSVTLVTPVTTSADLQITKTDAPEAVVAGGELIYTLEVYNGGPSDARTVVVTDALPAQVTFVSSSPGSPTCTHAAGTLTCNLGTLSYDTTVTIQINVIVRGDTPVGTISNTAEVESGTPDPTPSNNSDTETTTVSDRLSDLQVDISDSVDPATAGAGFSYTIEVTNVGPSSASNVILTQALPAQVTFVSSSPGSPTCTHAGGTLTCNLGDMPRWDTRTVTVVVNVSLTASGVLNSYATATATETDPVPDNNTNILEATQVQTRADLSVDITDQPDSVIAGNNLAYQVAIENIGPSIAANARLVFTLSSGVTFLSSTPGAPACSHAAGVVTCSLGSLNPQASAQVTITVRVNPATLNQVVSQAQVSSDTTDPVLGNNTSDEATTVYSFAELQLSVVDQPDPIKPGDTLTYALTVVNNGPSNALNLTLTNTLPNGVDFVSVTSGCTRSGGTVTCTMTSLAAGNQWQVTIVTRVNPTAPSSLLNQATVSSTTPDPYSGNNSAQTTTTVDRQPPTVAWLSPGPGSGYYQVGPTVRLEVNASDDLGIGRVVFALWDPVNLRWVEFATDTAAPYVYILDTWKIPAGWNEIAVIAYDRAGNDSGRFEDHWIFIFVERSVFMPFTVR